MHICDFSGPSNFSDSCTWILQSPSNIFATLYFSFAFSISPSTSCRISRLLSID